MHTGPRTHFRPLLPSLLAAVFAAACGGSDGTGAAPIRGGGRAAPNAVPPAPARRPVVDVYHGVKVEDPYRWLEADNDEVKSWSAGENRYARRILDGLPDVGVLRSEIRAIVTAPVMRYGLPVPAGGKWFASRKDPAKEQSELVVMDDVDRAGEARIVLDPAAGSEHRSIDWFVPSPDGTRVAVSISSRGSEAGTLHILDLEGRQVDAPIPNVQRGTGGGDVAWRPDGKGFWYTRYPAAGEKPEAERDFWMQVWFHEIGTEPARDRYELGKELPRIAEIRLASDSRGRVLASVQKGDGNVFRHYLRQPTGAWRQLDDWDDAVVFVGFGPTADLWMVSRQGAPKGKVLRLPASAKSVAEAKLVIPEAEHAVVTDYYSETGLRVAGGRVYLVHQLGGPTALRVYTLGGRRLDDPKLPPVSAVGGVVAWPGGVLFYTWSYLAPVALHRFSAKSGKVEEVAAMSPPAPVDLSGWEVRRETATSKDGARVPFNVVWRKGAPMDGSVPCLVTGYGGYGISQVPFPVHGQQPLLRRGICFAEANLRGGGEFGEEWHRAGMLTNKQNVFDDFAAVLDQMVALRYTSRDRLAILGGSNGGLLMGAMITQHPDKMAAVVSAVGIYDMLRVERSANGQYNVPEFGSVNDRAQFEALHAYSPYHRVEAGVAYPAILMITGANDPRVAPWHSRKMMAALRAAQAGDAPLLLRTSDVSGHGIGTAMSERIEELAHMQAFILWRLGRQGPSRR